MLKALVVDDEYLVRMGIRETIDWSAHGVEIVGEADNGEDGLALALQHEPDVIVTDVRMPFMNGLELIEKIKEHRLNAGIIVLSGYDEFQYAQAALRLGASSYLLKPVDTDELAASVRKLGLEAQARLAERALLGQLKNELPAIAAQFWLDLLQGRLQDEAEIASKRAMLDIGQTHGQTPDQPPDQPLQPHAAIVLENKARTAAPANEWLTEPIIADELKAHSLRAAAIIRTGPAQWTLVLPAAQLWSVELSRIRAFGYDLLARAKQAGTDIAVGIGIPAGTLAELKASYEAANAAVQRAAASLGGVWYALDEAEAGMRREIREALAYIRQHYASNITVENVASEVFVSPTHLMHLFRKALDKTFYECLTEYRIEEAKRMLRDPKYRVYEVSGRVGFGDAKYFSQIFKKMTGMTPSEYAKTEG